MQLYCDALTQEVLKTRNGLCAPDSYHSVLAVDCNTVGAKGNNEELEEDGLPRNKEQIRQRL